MHSEKLAWFQNAGFNLLIWNRYAKELVDIMYAEHGPDFGAASDGTCLVNFKSSMASISIKLIR